MSMPKAAELISCCAATYSHPLTRWLLGDSLHPGGLALTSQLATLAGVGPASIVLDVGSGRGASAVHLAKTIGCSVIGVTVEEDGVNAARQLSERGDVADRATFLRGDILQVDLARESFDVVLMECVLSIVADKSKVLDRVQSLMKPRGRLALTDVTVSGPLPAEWRSLLAVAGCVGDARTLDQYSSMVEGAGLDVQHRQDLPDTVTSLLHDAKGKLMMAELAANLGKLAVPQELLASGKEYLSMAQEMVARGTLSYGLVVARKPGSDGSGPRS